MLTFWGVAFIALGTYIGYLGTSFQREIAHSVSLSETLPRDGDVSDRYDRTARTFDADVELSERAMFMGSKRRDLIREARGEVLEVSCGTGRNVRYYGEKGVQRWRGLRFVDLSPEMVEVTKERVEEVGLGEGTGQRVVVAVGDAGEEGRPQTGRGYYDTVIQTMGICSMKDPVATLKHLGTITEPQNGRILLLEHGRSHYGWLNEILDDLAAGHADRHGCWWNRDIGEIVRESGLEVVEEKRWHLGTTWRYVLRPVDRKK